MEKSKNPPLPVRYVMYEQETKALLIKSTIPPLNNYTSDSNTVSKVA